MSIELTIVLMFVVTYLSRVVGLLLGDREIPAFWLRFLRFVPISVFAALVVPNIPSGADTPTRVLAAVVAAMVFHYHKQLWSGILVGMLVFWVLRAF